jgi:hypothetical protein
MRKASGRANDLSRCPLAFSYDSASNLAQVAVAHYAGAYFRTKTPS